MKKRTFNRRQFVTTFSAGVGTIFLAGTDRFGSILPGTARDPFEIVELGKTGIKTTLLGMGTGYNAINRSAAIIRAGKENAVSMVRAAYDKGIRYFDCADSYGTHPYVALALKDISRDKYTLGTKMWNRPGGIPEPERPDANIVVDRFRKELNSDYLDLVQIHCMEDGAWTDTQKRQMDILENLKAKKIIRSHGVSIHSIDALKAAAESPWVDVVHVRINPFGANMDKRDPALIVPLIEQIHNSGKGVIGMKLLGAGNFANDSEKINTSLKFVLGLGTVNMIIVGFEKPEQIDNYVERIRNIKA
jgi:aryl-alcohol dehydrogenase-like predicted oxidoreductase